MSEPLARSGRAMQAFVGAAFLAIVAVAAWPRYDAELATYPHSFAPVTDPVPGVFDFVAKNSTPQDKIFTTGPPGLYMEVNRLSALRESSLIDEFLVYYPGNTDVERVAHLRAQLVKNRPKIVILDPENSARKRRHMAALIQPFLTEFHYKQEGPYFYLRPN